MALIAFLMDVEEGHLLPSFGLAHSLKSRGHTIVYIGIPDNRQFISDQGFDFYPIFKEMYPEGYNESIKQDMLEQGHESATIDRLHLEDITGDALDAFWEQMKPDLFIISAFLRIESLLLYYKFGIRPVIFNPSLREPGKTFSSDCIEDIINLPADKAVAFIGYIKKMNVNMSSLPQLAGPLNEFCEVVACPQEIEIDRPADRSNIHYIGPSVKRRHDENTGKVLQAAAKDRKVIYASLGSQTITYGTICDIFFHKIINVMRYECMQHLHLVLSIGAGNSMEKFGILPKNITMVKWISQIDVLKISSLAFIHGGLGTIKECIYYGVPMIVMPLTRDQPANARRIEHHRLGVSYPTENISEVSLLSAIFRVLQSDDIKNNVLKMQAIFREKEQEDPGADIVEGILSKKR